MKKFIFSLIILVIIVIIASFFLKSKNIEKNIVVNNIYKDKDNNNSEENNLKIKNNFILETKPILHKIIDEKEERINHIEKIKHLAYLKYRETEQQMNQKKINHYLDYQSKLQHIREGGVKSDLQNEKRNHEVQFQHQYTSNMMSQRRDKEKNFLEQNKKVKERREQMQSLKQRQILQTKYKGEL